jgi:haloalkane dehalogenase
LLAQRDRFERIVLFNTGAFRPGFIPWRIRVCRTPVLGKLAVQGLNLFSLAALRMTLNHKRRLERNVAAGYLAPYSSWARRRAVYQFIKDIPLSARHPTWQTLGDIEDRLPELAGLPALLIWGMRDWCFTPECLDRFAAVSPCAEVHRLADVGHWVLEDAPEDAARLLQGFLRKTDGHG